MGGFVYVMSNPAMPELVKIGKSDRDPSEFRVKELYSTGVPEPFALDYYAYVDEHHRVETLVHRDLSDKRNNRNREFFRVRPIEAVASIRRASKPLFERVLFNEEEDQVENRAVSTGHTPKLLFRRDGKSTYMTGAEFIRMAMNLPDDMTEDGVKQYLDGIEINLEKDRSRKPKG